MKNTIYEKMKNDNLGECGVDYFIVDRDSYWDREWLLTLKDGTPCLFEYVENFRVFQDAGIIYDGYFWFATESQYNDCKTGKPCDTFYRYGDDNEMIELVVNLDGSFDIRF